MFNNPGYKIKLLARILFWFLGIASSLFFLVQYYLLCFFDSASEEVLIVSLFFLIPKMLVSWLIVWIVNLLLYGYGELIENSKKDET